ncbi:uncharacterized protein cenpt [Aulostomus maculatus]
MDLTEDLSARVLLQNILSTEPPRTPITRRAQNVSSVSQSTRSSRKGAGGQTPQDILRRSLKHKIRESISRKSLPPTKRRTVSALLRKTHTPSAASMLYDEGDTPRHILMNILRTEPVKSPVIHEGAAPEEPQLPSSNSSVNSGRPSVELSRLDLPDITIGPAVSTVKGLSRKRPRRSLNVTAFEKRLREGDENEEEASVNDQPSLSLSSSSTSLSLKTPFVDIRTEKKGLRRRVSNRRKITEEDFGAAVNRRQMEGDQGESSFAPAETSCPEGFTLGFSKLSEFEVTNDIVNCNTALYAQADGVTSNLSMLATQDKPTVLASQLQRETEQGEQSHLQGEKSAYLFPVEEGLMEEPQSQEAAEAQHTEGKSTADCEDEGDLAKPEDVSESQADDTRESDEEEDRVESQTATEGGAATQTGSEAAAESQSEEEEEAADSQTEAPVESQSEEEEEAADTQTEAPVESQSEEEEEEAADTQTEAPVESQSEEEEEAADTQTEAPVESQSEEEEEAADTQTEAPVESQSEEEEEAADTQTEAPVESQSEEEEEAKSDPREGLQEDATNSQTEDEAGGRQEEGQQAEQYVEHISRRAYRSEGGLLPATEAGGGRLDPTEEGGSDDKYRTYSVSEFPSGLETVGAPTPTGIPEFSSQEPAQNEAEPDADKENAFHQQVTHDVPDSGPPYISEAEDPADQEEEWEDDQDAEDSDELPMKTPAFVREKRNYFLVGPLASSAAFKNPPASCTLTPVRSLTPLSLQLQRVSQHVANTELSSEPCYSYSTSDRDLTPTEDEPAAKPKQARRRRRRSSKREAALPKSYLMAVFRHFAKTKVSADVYPVLKEIMDKFFDRLADDLETYAAHAKRKTLEVEDAELLLKRQGHVNDKVPVEVLIEKYLRLDQRKLLIPIATSGNVVIPKKR